MYILSLVFELYFWGILLFLLLSLIFLRDFIIVFEFMFFDVFLVVGILLLL